MIKENQRENRGLPAQHTWLRRTTSQGEPCVLMSPLILVSQLHSDRSRCYLCIYLSKGWNKPYEADKKKIQPLLKIYSQLFFLSNLQKYKARMTKVKDPIELQLASNVDC
jgi:hypothetical protein